MSGTIAYLGWDKHGNMGDIAMRQTYERQLPHLGMLSALHTPRDLVRFARKSEFDSLRNSHLLLGGGTVIGKRHWLAMIYGNLGIIRNRPVLMLGAGVEDPTFQGKDSKSSGAQLRQWKRILGAFDKVTVRGPRSAELLADIGVEAVVSGDPALLFSSEFGVPDPALIGVTLGYGSDLWSHNQESVVETASAALIQLCKKDKHLSVRLIVVSEEDLLSVAQCSTALAAANINCEVVLGINPESFIQHVKACNIFLGQRLHSVILATSMSIPSLMLAYQPKCIDYMRSIRQEAFIVRTDAVSAGELSDQLKELLVQRDALSGQVAKRVRDLRSVLSVEISRLDEVCLAAE